MASFGVAIPLYLAAVVFGVHAVIPAYADGATDGRNGVTDLRRRRTVTGVFYTLGNRRGLKERVRVVPPQGTE